MGAYFAEKPAGWSLRQAALSCAKRLRAIEPLPADEDTDAADAGGTGLAGAPFCGPCAGFPCVELAASCSDTFAPPLPEDVPDGDAAVPVAWGDVLLIFICCVGAKRQQGC